MKRKTRHTQPEVEHSKRSACLASVLLAFVAEMPDLAVENVVVHPLVLLSVVDHFNRLVKSIFMFVLMLIIDSK